MAVRPIILYPDPVLLRPTQPVEQVDDEVRELVEDMVETMYAAPGIGLAANQVGVSKRVFIVDLTAGEKPEALHAFINPVVVESEGLEIGEEGCLSFPDITLDVERATAVTLEALDLDGNPYRYTGEYRNRPADPGSDVEHVFAGGIAVTPLGLDLVSAPAIEVDFAGA